MTYNKFEELMETLLKRYENTSGKELFELQKEIGKLGHEYPAYDAEFNLKKKEKKK